jgi:hypothetical protein
MKTIVILALVLALLSSIAAAQCVDLGDAVIEDTEINTTVSALSLQRGDGYLEFLLPLGDHLTYGTFQFKCAEIEGFSHVFPISSVHNLDAQGDLAFGPNCGNDELYWSPGAVIADFYLETCGAHDWGRLEICYTCQCPELRVVINNTDNNTDSFIVVGGEIYESGDWIPLSENEVCESVPVMGAEIFVVLTITLLGLGIFGYKKLKVNK